MKKQIFTLLIALFSLSLYSQIGINTDNSNPHSSAMLDVISTDRGVLIPRMTEVQREAISSPATGLLVYQTDGPDGFYFYNGSIWESIDSGLSSWDVIGNDIGNANSGNVGIGTATFGAGEKLAVSNETTQFGIYPGYLDGVATNLWTTFDMPGFQWLRIWDHLSVYGNVGIGTTTPTKKLDVNGDALIHGLTVGTGNGDIASNTAVGFHALNSNTTGNSNTANGSNALSANTTGINNTATGADALRLNTTGSHNTAYGRSSLFDNTEGSGNTANGLDALRFNTTGSNNTAAGVNALQSNTEGNWNTANGALALQNNTTGISNTANGVSALQNNTEGINNTATGVDALNLNTTGINNTANGRSALISNTTGGSNAANGVNALRQNTTGNWNTANGFASLLNNTTGDYNVAIGLEALYSSTISGGNTAVGVRALYNAATAAEENTAVGFQAGFQTTTGGHNVIVGRDAFYNNTLGSNNTAIGFAALNSNTTGAGNTALGYGANVASGELSNATAIGFNAMVNASNSLVLGNNVNVGIGTSAPTHPLHMGSGAHVTAAGVWTNASDIAKKYDISELTYGLETILQMQPKTYRYKADDSQSIGFIAQELEKIIPEVVSGEDGEKGVAYGLLTSVIVNAMQEQQQIIEQLKAENAEMKVANAEIKVVNDAMKIKVEKVESLQAEIEEIKSMLEMRAEK